MRRMTASCLEAATSLEGLLTSLRHTLRRAWAGGFCHIQGAAAVLTFTSGCLDILARIQPKHVSRRKPHCGFKPQTGWLCGSGPAEFNLSVDTPPPVRLPPTSQSKTFQKNRPEMTGNHRMVRPASGSPPLCRRSSVSPTGASPTLSDHSFHTRSVLGTSSSLCSALTKEASSKKSKATDSLFVSVSRRL